MPRFDNPRAPWLDAVELVGGPIEGEPKPLWFTPIPISRADFYPPDEEGMEIHSLDLRYLVVHTGINELAVTLSGSQKLGETYGFEVDMTVADARKLAELLVSAAAHEEAGGDGKDF